MKTSPAHSPVTVKDGDFSIEISERGIVKLTKNLPNNEYDEMTIPARVVLKTADLLRLTRQDYVKKADRTPVARRDGEG